jgi:hypothetical protein
MLGFSEYLFHANHITEADMGALIMTKGTKRLVAHYNEEFGTWIDFYRGPAILPRFKRAGANINIWTDLVQTIKDLDNTNDHTERADNLTLLPKKHKKHVNLEARWKHFLQTVLTQPNQNKLADALNRALTDANTYITFDVRVGTAQDVVLTAEHDDGNPIAMITIVTTGPMLIRAAKKGSNPPALDE